MNSRLLIAARPPGKAAAPIAQAMHALLAPLPPTWGQKRIGRLRRTLPRKCETPHLGMKGGVEKHLDPR